jgi:hypothetical protein
MKALVAVERRCREQSDYADDAPQGRRPHTLDETLAETDRVNARIRQILDVATEDWGYW